MQRDWDIVRQILVKLDELGDSKSVLRSGELPPFDGEAVAYHIQIMQEAGLIDARVSASLNGPVQATANRMTWQGHEFLDRIRDQAVWNQVKSTARKSGVSMTFDAIKMIATAVVEAMIKGALGT